MEELNKWVQKKEDDLKDYDYPDPPILSPVAAIDCDKVSLPSDSDKQLDMPPPVELAISLPTKLTDLPSPLTAERDESKKSTPKAKQSHLKYQFQLRPCHAVKGRQKLFRCDICGGIYRHAFSLKRHFLRTHINYKYLSDADKSNCNITASAVNCNNKSTNSKGFDSNHWLPNEASNKSETKKPFDEQNDKRQQDFPFLFSCYSCQEYFHQQDELKTHVDNHVPIVKRKEFKCEKCKMTFTLKKNLRRHMAIHDSGRAFTCKYCNKEFFTLSSHKSHERIHEGKKSHKCSHCTASFIHYDNLKEHMQYQHGAYYYPCNVCSKFFGTGELLTLHAEEHMELSLAVKLNGKATLNCENDNFDCGRETTQFFDSSSNFDYTCTVCGKKFLSYVNMCRHHRLAHQASPKKRGRPQKSKVSRPEGDCRVAHNTVTENTETEFYNNIADKISDNLINFIDGKYFDLEQYCSNNSTLQIEIDSDLNVPWHSYNFPPNFDYSKIELSESESEVDSNIERNSEDLLSDSFYSGNESDIANLSNDVFDQYSDKDDQNCEIEDKVACGDKSIGQNIPLTYICCACVERFSSLVAIEEHKINNHPNIFCTHIEIEGDKDIPPELCQQFYSPIGIFKRYIVPTLNSQQNDGLACTKCKKIFNSVSDLHLHILECGGGLNFKTENSRKKSMRKKKLRQGMKFQTPSFQRKNDIDNVQNTNILKENVEILYNSTMQEREENKMYTPRKEDKISKTQLKVSVENSETYISLIQETDAIHIENNNILLEKVDDTQKVANKDDIETISESSMQEIRETQNEKSFCKELNAEISQDVSREDDKENFSSLLKDAKENSEMYNPQKRKDKETTEVSMQIDIGLPLNFTMQEAKESPPTKAYICKDCKKAFNHSLTFERHNRGCRQKMLLDRNVYKTFHWKEVKNIGQHPCPYCKCSFAQVATLKRHVKNSCHKKKLKRKVRKKLQNLKQMNFARMASIKPQCSIDRVDHNSNIENNDIKMKAEGKVNEFPQVINKNFASVIGENFKICSFDSEQKQSSVNTQINLSVSEKTDLTLEAEVPLSLKQIQNNESLQHELSFIGRREVKQENNSSRGLFPQQRSCPHCFRSFAYLANYRRHIKEVCPVKKQLVKETEGNGIKLKSSVPIFAATTCTVKGKIEDSVIGLLRDQSRQSELMRASEPEDGGPIPSPRFRTFSCKICHKIFLSFVKMLQHRLSHKLQSDESEDLPKLDLGLMEKLEESSTIDPGFEQQNAQEILNNLDDYLIKASEDELERAEKNIVILSHQSETDPLKHSKDPTENEVKTSNKILKDVHCCEACGKSFSSPASKLKHCRIAHKKNIPRKMKAINKNTKRIFKHSTTKPKSRSSELSISNINRVRKFGKQRTKHCKKDGTRRDRNLLY